MSHNLTAVASVCKTAILIEKGTKRTRVVAKTVLEQYIGSKTAAQI